MNNILEINNSGLHMTAFEYPQKKESRLLYDITNDVVDALEETLKTSGK